MKSASVFNTHLTKMYKVKFILCISFLIVNLYAKKAPFIDPCKWNDRECMIVSAQKAVPFMAAGISTLGISPLEPMHINEVTVNEDGLSIVFKNSILTGLKQCQITDVERDIQEHWLKVVLECPIDIKGQYTVSGKLSFIPIEGDGPFHIQTNNILISVKMDQNVNDNHWVLSNCVHTFEAKEKTLLHFENLYNGDEKKAAPILQIFDNQWKQLVQSIGKPIVTKVVNNVCTDIQHMASGLSTNDLEQL